jgi:hypothetical protein
MTFKRRGGRKEIIMPEEDDTQGLRAPRSQSALICAIVRAHRWKELLESGIYMSLSALAAELGVNSSYVGRLLNLTLLAPDIVEDILLGRETDGVSLERLYRLPRAWEEQREVLGLTAK